MELTDEQRKFWLDEGAGFRESSDKPDTDDVNVIDINDLIIPIEEVYKGRINIQSEIF